MAEWRLGVFLIADEVCKQHLCHLIAGKVELVFVLATRIWINFLF